MAKRTKEEIEEILQPLRNHTILKDSIVFKEDIHFKGNFYLDNIISDYLPELSGKKKWIFKKNLIIDGLVFIDKTGLEVEGDMKVGGSILGHRASFLLRKNLNVDGYLITSVADQCGLLPKFACEGIVKATFVSTNSKVKIKGSFHPDTILIVNDKRTKIEGYDCHYRAEIKHDYWTKECKKNEGRGFIWLEYDKMFEDLKAGKNIFIEG